MANILLVTGSRSLAQREHGEAWAFAKIKAAMDAQNTTLLVCGDASGGDHYARVLADAMMLHFAVFHSHGPEAGQRHESWCDRYVPWASPEEVQRWTARELHLTRDSRMVAWVQRRLVHGEGRHAARVLALRDAKSPTSGAAYTARKAREAGLEVTEEVFNG